jgi:hypothetical protein
MKARGAPRLYIQIAVKRAGRGNLEAIWLRDRRIDSGCFGRHVLILYARENADAVTFLTVSQRDT